MLLLRRAQKLSSLFSLWDTNCSGYLHIEELMAVLSHWNEFGSDECRKQSKALTYSIIYQCKPLTYSIIYQCKPLAYSIIYQCKELVYSIIYLMYFIVVETSLETLGMIGNQVNKTQFINLLEMFTDDMNHNELKDFLELMQSSIKVTNNNNNNNNN